MNGDWLTSKAAAGRLGIHKNTLLKWAGELAPPQEVAVKMNGTRWRWNPDVGVLLRWSASRRTTP